MSLLNNPNFIGLDGNPTTGVVPPVIRNHGPEMTPKQFGEVTHTFKMFMGAAKVMTAPMLIQKRTLADGTRVEMRTERFGVVTNTVVDVWPTGGSRKGYRLAHGVSAQVTWSEQVKHYYFDEKKWKFGPGTPQIGQGTTTGNHAMFELPDPKDLPNRYMFLPMIHAAGKSGSYSLWTFSKGEGLKRGKDSLGNELEAVKRALPVSVRKTKGKEIQLSWVFSDERKIYKHDGTVIIETPEVAPRNPGEESTPIKYPPSTNTAGNVLYHTQGRTFCVSQTLERYNFLFGHQTYVPEGKIYIAQGTMKSKNFTVPLGWTPTITADGKAGAKKEVNKSLVKEKGLMAGPNGYGSSRQVSPPLTPVIGWVSQPHFFKDSTDTVTDYAGGWAEEDRTKGNDVEITELLPLPNNAAGAAYIKFVNALSYPQKYTFAAGKTTVSADRTPFGYAQNGKLRSGAGVSSMARVDRIYTHEVDATPHIALDCGALGRLKIFEGATYGEFNGKICEDIKTTFNPFSSPDYCPSLGGNSYYMPDGTPPDEPEGSTALGHAWHAWVMAGHLDFESLLAQYPNKSEVVEDNEALEQNGEYEFISRHIIDFDSRIGLTTMIKVTVTCIDAKWKEKSGSYRGHMELDGLPQYTVKIGIAWCHKTFDTSKETEEILVEASFSRPPMEFKLTTPGNPFIWPTPESEYTIFYLTMPPELSPPYQAYHQLYRIPYGQAFNDNLAGSDILPDLPPVDVKQQDKNDLQYSKTVGEEVTYHDKIPQATIYGRSFTIAEFDDALWMLRKLKIDSGELGKMPDDTVPYFYCPAIKDALPVKRRLELVNGEKKQWSDDFPADEGKTKPDFVDRETVVYYV